MRYTSQVSFSQLRFAICQNRIVTGYLGQLLFGFEIIKLAQQ